MAKKRSPNAYLEETVESFALLTPDEPPGAASPEPPAAPVVVETREVTVTIPLRPTVTPKYSARHVEVQLDEPQAVALTEIREALDNKQVRLKSGRRVVSSADALRWLLERFAGDRQ